MQPIRTGIHPTALVADGAKLAEGVAIGPGCVVGPHVELGAGTVLHAHVVVEGRTRLGPRCEVFPFASLGARPQDKKLGQDPATMIRDGWMSADGDWLGRLEIGADNMIRECVTIHGGTPHGGGVTRIGDGNMLLAGAHIGHDCRIGSRVVFTNGAMTAGHTDVADNVVFGAMVGIHQFARVGRNTMIGAGSMLSHDAPPFSLVQGDRARLVGVNLIGLKRSGFADAETSAIKRVYRLVFWRTGLLRDRLAAAEQFAKDHPVAQEVIDFVRASERGVCTPRERPSGDASFSEESPSTSS